MPKFFVTQDKISDNQIIIDSEDVTHISRVLRLEKGDNVTVCDGQGTDYDAQIDTIEPKKILLNIISRQKSETEPNIKVTLFQALPKASKMEYIIQKTTELGISEIVPVKLSRCVVKIDNKKDIIYINRFPRIMGRRSFSNENRRNSQRSQRTGKRVEETRTKRRFRANDGISS